MFDPYIPMILMRKAFISIFTTKIEVIHGILHHPHHLLQGQLCILQRDIAKTDCVHIKKARLRKGGLARL